MSGSPPSAFLRALGIAATTAIWTVLEAVVLRPLPYAQPEALVSVAHPANVPGSGPSTWGLSEAGYFHFRDRSRLLEELGAYATSDLTVMGEGESERVRTAEVSASLLQLLRARQAAGRLIQPTDDRPGVPPVVVLGHGLWQRRYGGDPGIVGRTIELGQGPVQVVGVIERGFDLPLGGPVDLWLPLQLDPTAPPVNSHYLSAVGRMAPGATSEAVRRELQDETDRFTELFPEAYSRSFMDGYEFRLGVEPLRDMVLGERIARTLWVAFAAVGLVLLIACANVANLLMVRMEGRRREAAIRGALGASRGQMATHYLAESTLLSLAAGALGVALAMALGARVSQVAGMVVRQSLTLAVVGVSLGLVGAMAATRVIGSLLYGVSPTAPLTLALVALSLLAVATLASLAPAMRAARVDPVVTLRNE